MTDRTGHWPEVPQPPKINKRQPRELDLRYWPNIQKPDRYVAGQYPILIKGTEGHYVQRQTLNLAGLISRQPGIHEGVSKWIRAFEEETVRKMLAQGDIKAVWA